MAPQVGRIARWIERELAGERADGSDAGSEAKIAVQATEGQIGAWTAAARKMGKASPGAFVAWAADMYLALADAYKKQVDRHLDECAGLLPPPRPSELKKLVDAAWHALDFLPEDAGSAAPGGLTDPRGDLRRALEAIQDLERLP